MKIKLIKFIAIAFLIVSCDNYDFGDINVNPNNPSSANPQALLTNAIVRSRTMFLTTPSLYVQWLSQTQYTEASLYQQNPSGFSGIYSNILSELNAAIALNKGDNKDDVIVFGSNKNQIAVLEIYKAFVFSKITDVWGDVPYSEALDKNIIAPKYDDQEAIYKDIISKLTDAEASLDASESSMNDIIYHGDVAKWKKFANSLRMIYALRLSKKFPAAGGYAATEFSKAFTDADGYIATNADNFVFYTNDDYKNAWYSTFDGRNDYALSNTFVDKLKAINDKRIEVYATPTSTGDYVGVPYGWDRPSTLAWTDANEYSPKIGASLRKKDTPIDMLTASQVNFAIAEAIARGWVAGNAATFYENGITESYLNLGLTAADATAYIANVPYNAGSAIEDIAVQRWIALFPTGSLEAWSSWRRTGFPTLTPARDALNVDEGGQIPVRYLYPSDEANVNADNLAAAIAKLPNGDKGTSPFWWVQ